MDFFPAPQAKLLMYHQRKKRKFIVKAKHAKGKQII